MLDLQPCVHLDERKPAFGVEQKLDRTGVLIAAADTSQPRGVGHRLAGGLVERRRRALLDQLLVATLHRTVALAQHQHPARTVGQHLHLDVTGIDDRLLEIHIAVTERRSGLGGRQPVGIRQTRLRFDHPHATAAPACDRLEQHRIPNLGGQRGRLVGPRKTVQ